MLWEVKYRKELEITCYSCGSKLLEILPAFSVYESTIPGYIKHVTVHVIVTV